MYSRKTVIVVSMQDYESLELAIDDLRERGFEFTTSDFLSLTGQSSVFTMLGADVETAKEISSILNYVPDYRI